MNVNGKMPDAPAMNVLSLFGRPNQGLEFIPDPLTELLKSHELEAADVEIAPLRAERRRVVRDDQFPEQGLYILDQQLAGLKESLGRIKFYLSDLDDLLPR